MVWTKGQNNSSLTAPADTCDNANVVNSTPDILKHPAVHHTGPTSVLLSVIREETMEEIESDNQSVVSETEKCDDTNKENVKLTLTIVNDDRDNTESGNSSLVDVNDSFEKLAPPNGFSTPSENVNQLDLLSTVNNVNGEDKNMDRSNNPETVSMSDRSSVSPSNIEEMKLTHIDDIMANMYSNYDVISLNSTTSSMETTTYCTDVMGKEVKFIQSIGKCCILS